MSTGFNEGKKPATEGPWSWIDFRRRVELPSEEKRETQRVEIHCPVIIEGVTGEKRITDISLGGVFIECENTLRRRFQTGETLRLFVKLPTEDELMTIRVQVVDVGERGIGCRFIELNQKSEEAIRYCLSVLRHTLPII